MRYWAILGVVVVGLFMVFGLGLRYIDARPSASVPVIEADAPVRPCVSLDMAAYCVRRVVVDYERGRLSVVLVNDAELRFVFVDIDEQGTLQPFVDAVLRECIGVLPGDGSIGE